jgi:TPR repeat protein
LWLGLKRDFDDGARWPEAARWYAIAARGGNVHAMVNYGVCLERGLGVRRRLDRAARWFNKAARLGDRDARKALRRLQRGRPLAPVLH